MACFLTVKRLTREQREVLKELEKQLAIGRIRTRYNPQGQFQRFEGWQDKQGWCDGCAYRVLQAQRSPALKAAQVTNLSVKFRNGGR